MIRIINGSTLIGGALVAAGQVVCASAEEEANLTARGVAEYVGEDPAGNPAVPEEDAGHAEIPAEEQTEEAEDVAYAEMSAAQLRALCDERGIPYKKNASARALRALLEDGAMPVLAAADPVDA